MCRIVGFWDFNRTVSYSTEDTILRMRDTLAHGGPDDAGMYQDPKNTLCLGHRRLSILDLSSAGHQPMQRGNKFIVYNGEIYNFQEVRDELIQKGVSFHTHSDTEVILAGFEVWGLDVVSKFRGMFSFAIWDQLKEELLLCRDRVGVKPLYWYLKESLFMFASELKAFHCHPLFDRSIQHQAIPLFLQLGYIPTPFSIFKFAHKLEPGTFLKIRKDGQIQKIPFWDLNARLDSMTHSGKNEETIASELESILEKSFQLRTVSDVPVGVFLSGGIDSSLVAALLQKNESSPIKTFTIGFENKDYNEAVWAKKVANHLHTDHTEFYCKQKDFLEVIPQLPVFYDEPFGDSSAIPTFIVSRLAKQKVSVALSADGGDEIFGGYDKYRITSDQFSKIARIPLPIRKYVQPLLESIDPIGLEKISHHIPYLNQFKNIKDKFYKFRNALDAKTMEEFFHKSGRYISLSELSKWTNLDNNPLFFDFKDIPISQSNILQFLGFIDIKTYMMDDILVKTDRASMRVALEVREPFLDHHIIEYGLALPDQFKIRNGKSKYMLRKILYQYIPAEFIDRPKQGFGIPIYTWLREELRSDLIAITTDQSFFDCMKLNQVPIADTINAFINNQKFCNAHLIWFVYMLWRWYHTWINLTPS